MNDQNPNQTPKDSEEVDATGLNAAPLSDEAGETPSARTQPEPTGGASAHYYPHQTPYRWDYQNYAELEKKNQHKKSVGGRIALVIILVVLALLIILSVGTWQDYVGGASGEDSSRQTTSSAVAAPEISIASDGEGSVSDTTPKEYLSVSAIAAKVRPSVVGVQSYKAEIPFAASGEGSGIISSADGYIVTNYHVIDGADGIVVILSTGKKYEAKLVGGDSFTDLAVLKIQATGLPAATFGDPTKMSVGDYVVAIGNPGGVEFAGSVTMGIVSALDRPIQTGDGLTMKCIQTDATINPGNSGGALINTKGEVIGINSAKIVSEGFENMGFAISMSEAQPILNQLIRYGAVVNRVKLGLEVGVVDQVSARVYKVPTGLFITKINTTSAAYQAGLRKGDILLSLDGTALQFSSDLTQLLNKKKPGDTVSFVIYRANPLGNSSRSTIKVKLEQTDGK